MKSALVLVAVLLLIAACSSAANTGTGAVGTTMAKPDASTPTIDEGDLAFGLRHCATTDSVATRSPEFYADQPAFELADRRTEAIRGWALQQPAFEGLWIERRDDNDQGGWLTLGFSADYEQRHADLIAEFPIGGVVAVPVPSTKAALEALHAEVIAALGNVESLSSTNIGTGFVEAHVPVLDEATLAPLSVFADQPLCVSGTDPAMAIETRPQLQFGDGWRLLGEGLGAGDRAGIATSDSQFDFLWGQLHMDATRPDVDFDDEIVVWLGAVESGSCPIQMDDVVLDAEKIYGVYGAVADHVSCTMDARPHVFVVAVERASVPAPPFFVQATEFTDPRRFRERTRVEADLRTPGSIATDDQTGPDD